LLPDYPTGDAVLQDPLTQKKDKLLCDFHCTHAAVGEPADSFITEKRHAPRQIFFAPWKPSASQGIASSQKKDMILCNFHCTQEADGERGQIYYKEKTKSSSRIVTSTIHVMM
jgi:hypothetical protein